ncbi:class I SAM-dependent methyltransferase [Myroides sp. 1354]|uniref:class I SAM-dependent methyltransferase n=1 Tax=unclassified Myroides TaxID=2642485 RepID=UPI0025764018|nr:MULTISPECIES: class I SAM-dependent methyltransferase [unclassified Myroides]MDM1046313.1 class I SAM-dependent methyltransferase [Myroides sp. R163-1]MDM1057250.1 class I SAM-dependent methyltransferase [Myroides sp. 1354]MDM1070421.1 class I SAM-dependent methyltransferase [Myroides sp. 1372]
MKENIYSEVYIQGLFNRMSSSYERVNYLSSFGFSLRWRKQFLKPMKLTTENAQLIDLMTGMGETWGAIHQAFPKAKLTALDFSEGMLQYAQTKNKKKFNAQVEVTLQNVLSNDLPSDFYDGVTCAFGLKTLNEEQIQILAQQVKRILKPGGQFSFIEVSEPNNVILKFLYSFYLSKIIPLLGKMLFGGVREYKMLWEYTNRFKNAKQVEATFQAVGLKTTYQSYFFGCATGVYGEK